jgi:hypothetical protein
MLDKNFLNSFLKINSASDHLTDDEVRTTLVNAGWSQAEIDAAISLLRSGAGGIDLPQGEGAAAFRPELEFSSEQLSGFLGVDIQIDPAKLHAGGYYASVNSFPVREMIVRAALATTVIALSLCIAGALGFCFIYYLEIGPFAP